MHQCVGETCMHFQLLCNSNQQTRPPPPHPPTPTPLLSQQCSWGRCALCCVGLCSTTSCCPSQHVPRDPASLPADAALLMMTTPWHNSCSQGAHTQTPSPHNLFLHTSQQTLHIHRQEIALERVWNDQIHPTPPPPPNPFPFTHCKCNTNSRICRMMSSEESELYTTAWSFACLMSTMEIPFGKVSVIMSIRSTGREKENKTKTVCFRDIPFIYTVCTDFHLE